MNKNYRILTEALDLMGFENATVCYNVAMNSFISRLSCFNQLDTTALDYICQDLNKQYEDKGSGLEFVPQQEVLLKGLMHFVQDTTHVDRSVEDTKLDDMIYNTR